MHARIAHVHPQGEIFNQVTTQVQERLDLRQPAGQRMNNVRLVSSERYGGSKPSSFRPSISPQAATEGFPICT